jgi:hypothetical protein
MCDHGSLRMSLRDVFLFVLETFYCSFFVFLILCPFISVLFIYVLLLFVLLLHRTHYLDESDKRKIQSLEWLTFHDADRPEAIRQSNTAMRGFLQAGKIEAAKQVLGMLPYVAPYHHHHPPTHPPTTTTTHHHHHVRSPVFVCLFCSNSPVRCELMMFSLCRFRMRNLATVFFVLFVYMDMYTTSPPPHTHTHTPHTHTHTRHFDHRYESDTVAEAQIGQRRFAFELLDELKEYVALHTTVYRTANPFHSVSSCSTVFYSDST